ncbi:MAG: hypothetical protein HW386_906 [Gammaproteobacteria bacterium]|nr:hypothetical protein [Gammaproteobacteria bacterium]
MIMFNQVSVFSPKLGCVVASVVLTETTVRGLPARILPETTRAGWCHGGKEVNQQPWTSPHISLPDVTRASRCRRGGPHGLKDADGIADTMSKRPEGVRYGTPSRSATAVGGW